MISHILRIITCTSSFFYTFYVLCLLTYFLSKPIEYDDSHSEQEGESIIRKTSWSLLVNTSLLSAFILQHSVMASDFIKNIYYKLKIEDIERSIYNASSALVLHFLISEWQHTPWASVWNFTSPQSNKIWIVTIAFQIIGWFSVYSACMMMDISDLAGLKQVYYKISNRPNPITMKSRELQRYFMHMRHPSLIGFLVIFWVYPLMSVDRLLLASLLSIYMVLMWTIDEDDYNYHSLIIARKQRELSNKNF